ncbi:MAG: SurA N-terminal domain-containing protein [Helicobacteraceae bacterium]|jgi:peptidyl-prolyl cis-trans isomerase D|nr:SurA N-terminal domain-containing protein [Helicobacteraceae bacterium]
MIAALQRHRTFLVAVLAVTVVAFIGSSAVGWGSYSYGSRASAIATVGSEQISREQFTRYYGELRELYGGMLDQPLNEAQDRELQNNVLSSMIQEALLVAYAREIGLRVADEEISKLIVENPNFQINGVFDKKLYLDYLSNMRLEIKSYETGLERRLLVSKLDAALRLPATQSEKETVAATQYGVDRVTYQIINAPTAIPISRQEALAYYEANRLQFMGEPNYDVSFIKILTADQNANDEDALAYYNRAKSEFIGEDGEVRPYDEVKTEALNGEKRARARREALSAKIAWRDGQITPSVAKGAEFRNDLLPIEAMQTLENAQSLEIAGPFEIAEGFAIAKIDARRAAEPLPFDKARSAVEEEIKRQKIAEYLQTESEKRLQNFKGQTTGFVSRADYDKIKGLSEDEAETFLERIFNSATLEGAIELGRKAVVYRVLEQKLFEPAKLTEIDGGLSEEALRLKAEQIRRSLLEALQSRYEIIVYQR